MSINNRVFIRVYLGQELKEVFQSGDFQIVIGAEGDAHLKITGEGISPVHTLIEKRGESFYICDLGSQTGTFLDGQQVLDESIQSGQEIKIGQYRLEFFIGLPKPVATTKNTNAPKLEDRLVQKPSSEVNNTPKKEDSVKHTLPKEPISKPSAVSTPSEKRELPENPRMMPPQEVSQPKINVSAKEVVTPVSQVQNIVVPSVEHFEKPDVIGTYAPSEQIDNIKTYIKPSKGSIVEVSISWQDRILNTYHFDTQQVVTVGSHPKNTISLPVIQQRSSHPLLKLDSQVKVFITSDMNGEVQVNDQVTTLSEMIVKGRLAREGVGYSVVLDQGSVIRVELSDGIVAHIRFVAPVPKPIAAPFFYFSTSEVATIVASILVVGLAYLYFLIYEAEPVDQIPEEEVQRVAKFIYERPKQRFEVAETQQTAQTTAQPIKDKEVAKSRGTEGKASEAMPNKSQSQVVKLTTPNPGTGKGISKAPTNQVAKPDSGAKSQRPDPTKSGLFSTFGNKGTQDQLSQAYQGSGALGGLANRATGTGGSANVGAGDTPGTGLKDIGAGGEGTSTYGIKGVDTKGRGGGLQGYGDGNLGAKPRATIVPGGEGESFTGTIDREAIRRVIINNQKQIEACYERTLNRQPGLIGKVNFEWVITTNGRVKDARVSSSTLGSQEVENCILSRLRTWKFPEPPPDQEAVVNYPFYFNATN